MSTGRLPSQVPIEYDLLKEVPLPTLRNRLVSFSHFTLSLTALKICEEISVQYNNYILHIFSSMSVFPQVLLHHFSDLVCQSISMFDLCSPPEDDEGEGAVVSRLRAIVVSSAKETAFKKVRHIM